MLKKYFTMSIMLLLCIVIIPIRSYATFVFSGDCSMADNSSRVSWVLNYDGTLTISGNGAMKNYGTYSSPPWMDNIDMIRTIKIEAGVTHIGDNAFSGCTSLTEVSFDDASTLSSIGALSFSQCSNLSEVIFPHSLKHIGTYAFTDCDSLTDIILPYSLEKLNIGVFTECDKLQSITIYRNLKEIESHALPSTIKDIYYAGSESQWNEIEFSFISPISGATIHYNGVGIVAFGSCGEKGDNLTWSLSKNGTLTISGSGAMEDKFIPAWNSYDSDIKTVAINEGVTTISGNAFSGCESLTNVILPSTMTNIGAYAFWHSDSLSNIVYMGENYAAITISNTSGIDSNMINCCDYVVVATYDLMGRMISLASNFSHNAPQNLHDQKAFFLNQHYQPVCALIQL